MSLNTDKISIILPSKNEADSLPTLIPALKNAYASAEIIVVDDGSDDNTREICLKEGIRVISHPYSKGNGAAVKTGARAATREIIVFMDADGQHQPEHIPPLLEMLDTGYDMVMGARRKDSQANSGRWLANSLFSKLASWMVGQRIVDLTSGLRAVRADKFKQFLHLLPNGFSYPTTITMSFFRAGYSVGYTEVSVKDRKSGSNSHIRPLADGVKFLLIIFRIATLYSPLKIFVPLSALFFLSGSMYYAYTFFTQGRFTNGTGLLLLAAVFIFLIGLVSEQITHLLYSTRAENHPDETKKR